jgi:hypothetical protein
MSLNIMTLISDKKGAIGAHQQQTIFLIIELKSISWWIPLGLLHYIIKNLLNIITEMLFWR